MGRSCPFLLPYNALGKSKPETVRSLLLLAVIASRVTRRSSMPRAMAGAGLARRPLASVRVRGPCHCGRGSMRCTQPDVYAHIQQDRSHGLTRSPVALSSNCPPLSRMPAPRGSSLRGSRAPDYGPVGHPGVDLSGSLGWRAGSGPASSGRAGTGGIARRHGHR